MKIRKINFFTLSSANSKLSRLNNVSCSYLPINKTCPKECSYKDNGCYAQLGRVGLINNRLESLTEEMTSLDIINFESAQIISNPSQRFLRLHVSGDVSSNEEVLILENAISHWKSRGGEYAWTYTHNWRKINSKNWKNISALASVENIKEASQARKNGYVPAIVVENFPNKSKIFKIGKSSVNWIPCPNQVIDVTCVECKLCMRTDLLKKKNYGIAFAAHGVKKKRMLEVIR